MTWSRTLCLLCKSVEVALLGCIEDLLDLYSRDLLLPIKRVDTIDLLLDVRAIGMVSADTETMRRGTIRTEENLQLCIHKPSAMSSLDDCLAEGIDALQQVTGITGCRISPITPTALWLDFICFSSGWCDVDTGELGTDDRTSGAVLYGWLDIPDRADEHGPSRPVSLSQALKGSTVLGELRCICVIVECAQVCQNMLPPAVIIDRTSGVEAPLMNELDTQ